jgi:beta-lactamase class A
MRPSGMATNHSEELLVVSRRKLLGVAVAAGLSACTAHPNRPVLAPNPSTIPSDAPTHLAALERSHNARLGLYALDTRSNASLAYRADERFALCSTFKTLAAAAVLTRHLLSYLNTVVTYTRADVNSISPVTEQHIRTGMAIGQLCEAAVSHSDGTAGNLLMRDVGGPAQLTAYLRGLGDTVTRMDQYEPELNLNPPGDPRDTTAPRAIATTFQRILLGDALTEDKRALVTGWMRAATPLPRIRAGVPGGWTVADKTGTGDYGRANDIGILWPPGRAPIILALMSDSAINKGAAFTSQNALLVDATRYVCSVLAQ